MLKPNVMMGAKAFDDRGSVAFVNDFNFDGVRRFYMVENHRQGFVRAWHGHKKEAKYILVVSGAALIGTVKIDHWEDPSPDLQPEKFVLSEQKPTTLYVPPGYANGFKSLTPNLKIMFFSTATMEETKGDDFRYAARKWDCWEIEER